MELDYYMMTSPLGHEVYVVDDALLNTCQNECCTVSAFVDVGEVGIETSYIPPGADPFADNAWILDGAGWTGSDTRLAAC